MPELPEVESARAVLSRYALQRPIADVDDADTYVCRPHHPGEIRAALVGRSLTAAHRRGKSMWCDTSDDGPVLGIHLGMSGKVVFAAADGEEVDGGDYWERGRAKGDYRFARFAVRFEDGTSLLLVDPRRLGRVRLDPPVERLGPDAREITPAQFRAMISRGTAPVKARLLDQEAVAGVGNLLADQTLWLAKINPARPVDELSKPEVDRLLRALRTAVTSAVEGGGVHVLSVLPARHPDGRCPRCGAQMHRGVVGGRTTWWCGREQSR
ncbi:DNA-formamidopyrimidine glycosylase family protein [Dactylosporangium sp. AC04546]|uniref:Fpg/Nei family DNA glycosylase n=1 Tax=Dactylosporangium sp. AC04546 TaxID=2862460 RepID=UPI001EE0E4CA|nr:DNA-formamidopyrimidine glycosylase family protein [Dactylosporangium sp. AC04546]WVK82737.1 DNA-formamidopyrimidine glycosylase family protein [Dactylosporangium sp. AC04546]